MKFIAWALAILAGSVFVADGARADATYVAELTPLNSTVTGSEAKGKATFEVKGDQLTIVVDMEGTPPGIMHLQHFHGFPDSAKAAACPGPEADTNKDGVIDLIETEPMAGTTMVPFHADPISMQIPSDTYPSASPRGSYHYEKTVSLKALQEAFGKAFGGQDLNLDKRVVFVHGVFPDAKLPATAGSLPKVPVTVTLPIACGKIEPAK
jgi:hypothetical protein